MITDLAESLTGEHFYNVPTCGVVGVGYSGENMFENILESGSLLFFDYPKNLISWDVFRFLVNIFTISRGI